MVNDIDVVVLWVDGGKEEWIESYNYYKKKVDPTFSGIEKERYRDMNTFPYFFRSIQKYAPWVRKIHLVTDGNFPEWIDITYEKLNLVSHSDFIPKEYLPTFNSHTIELNLHRIVGLSDKFVYFNDDHFLNKKTSEDFFFKNNLPVDSFFMHPNMDNNISSFPFGSIVHNDLSIINKNFTKKNVILKNLSKVFNPRYELNAILKNIFSIPWSLFYGFNFTHLPQPLLKKTFEDVWDKEFEYLHSCCLEKFRSANQVNQYLLRYWQLCSGTFIPVTNKKRGLFFNLSSYNIDQVIKSLNDSNVSMLCINDSHELDDFDRLTELLINAFKLKFKDKSKFEK